jgi:hypothetical protein
MLTRVLASVPSPARIPPPEGAGAGHLTLTGAGRIVIEPDRHDPEARNERHRMA